MTDITEFKEIFVVAELDVVLLLLELLHQPPSEGLFDLRTKSSASALYFL